jgi:hypothetical protein
MIPSFFSKKIFENKDSMKRKLANEETVAKRKKEDDMYKKLGFVLTDPARIQAWEENEKREEDRRKEQENQRYIDTHEKKIRRRENASFYGQNEIHQQRQYDVPSHVTRDMKNYMHYLFYDAVPPEHYYDIPKVSFTPPWFNKTTQQEILKTGRPFRQAKPTVWDDDNTGYYEAAANSEDDPLLRRFFQRTLHGEEEDKIRKSKKVLMKRQLKYKKNK